MTAPAPRGRTVINNHIAKRAPSRHDDAVRTKAGSDSGPPFGILPVLPFSKDLILCEPEGHARE